MCFRFIFPKYLHKHHANFSPIEYKTFSRKSYDIPVPDLVSSDSVFADYKFNFLLPFRFQFQLCQPEVKMTAQFFRAHGKFCASRPWEVIVALLTLTACMVTVERSKSSVPPRLRNCQGWRESCEGLEAEYVAVDTIIMTVIRCSAILYSYYQFLNLNKFGSKNILSEYPVTGRTEINFLHKKHAFVPITVFAGLFAVVSSCIFTSSIVNFLGSEVSDLK